MNTTPIEFMVWDSDTKKMISMDKFNHYEDEPTHNEKIGQFFNWYFGCEMMQRTALLSINDEPIYNHMIVKDTLDDLYEVDMFDYNLMAYLGSDNLEIVGNRFQSPELLELCK